jgi:hypothetical protein
MISRARRAKSHRPFRSRAAGLLITASCPILAIGVPILLIYMKRHADDPIRVPVAQFAALSEEERLRAEAFWAVTKSEDGKQVLLRWPPIQAPLSLRTLARSTLLWLGLMRDADDRIPT